jgi:hypothetical protein
MDEMSLTEIDQRKQYLEVVSAALENDASNAEFPPEQLVELLRFLVTGMGASPEDQLATWLSNAL